ncbi:hypothetical protein HDV00_012512 [Rhizophlyctis rosea]|nr:hypothetical protein HDV00_012512 [Rhizophlyctis rosea]
MFGGGGFGTNPQQPAFGQPQQQQTSLFGGQQQQQQPQTGFGGFGAQPAQPMGAFGTTPAFGQQPQQQTSAFGAPAAGGFGASTSAFGQQNRPAFGAASTGTSLFGGGTSTTQAQTGFGFGTAGATNTFGSAQPSTGAFGAAPSAFGGGASTFGAPAGGAFGGANQTSNVQNNGTGNPPYNAVDEKSVTPGVTGTGPSQFFANIGGMPAYQSWSFEELRLQDYSMGKKFGPNPSAGGAPGGAFGGFGAGSSTFGTTPAFGAATTTAPSTSLFGQQNTQSAFGQPAQQQSGFGFGQQSTAPSTSLFGQQPQATSAPSLFGATSTPAFGAPATTTPFGQQQQPTTGFGAGGFGQATTQAKPFGAFGTTPATTTNAFGTGGNAFGGGGSSFSFNKPTTTAPAFGGFGNTAAPAASTSLFGQSTAAPTSSAFGAGATGTSLFGTQAKPAGFGFGATSTPAFGATTAAPTTGLFGGGTAPSGQANLFGAPQPQQQQTTNLFGGAGSTTGGFGTGTGFGTAAAGTTGMFGNQPRPPSTGLFGATPQAGAAPVQGFGFGQTSAAPLFGGSTAPAGTFGAPTQGGLFGGGVFGGGTQTTGFGFGGNTGTSHLQQPLLQASIDKDPYGNNPLFQSGPQTGGAPAGPTLMPPPADKKKPALTPHFKIAPQSASKIKLRGIGVSPMKKAPSFTSPSGFQLFDGTGNDKLMAGLDSRFTPRKSVKKLDLDDHSKTPSGNATKGGATGQKNVAFVDQSIVNSPDGRVLDVTSDSFALTPGGLKTPTPQGRTRGPELSSTTSVSATPTSSPGTQDRHSPTPSTPSRTPKSPAPNSAYTTIPSIEELLKRDDASLQAVQGFCVKLPGVGKVSFLEPVDLLAASPTGDRGGIRDIPGNVIVIEPKVITVYPDEEKKHPVGLGVNVPAQVVLKKCWPLDKSTREAITDPTDPRYDRHLRKLRDMPGTEFVDFSSSGAWTFKVEHFSKYGLLDDDEHEDGGTGGGDAGTSGGSGFGQKTPTASTGGAGFEQGQDTLTNSVGAGSVQSSSTSSPFRSTFQGTHLPRKPRVLVDLSKPENQSEAESEDEGHNEQSEEVTGESEGSQEDFESEESEGTYESEEEEDENATGDEDEMEEDEEEDGTSEDRETDESVAEEEVEEQRTAVAHGYTPQTIRNVQNYKRAMFSGPSTQTPRAIPSVGRPTNFSAGPVRFDASTYRVGSASAAPVKSLSFDASSIASDATSSVPHFSSPVPTTAKRSRTPFGQFDDDSGSTFAPRSSFRTSFGQEQTVPGSSDDEAAEDSTEVDALPSPSKVQKVGEAVAVDVAGKLVPRSESVTVGKEGLVVDAGLAFGRSFRVGWGPGGKLIVAGSFAGFDQPGKVSVCKLAVFGSTDQTVLSQEISRHQKTLETVHRNSVIVRAASRNGGELETHDDDEDEAMPMDTSDDEDLTLKGTPKATLHASLSFTSLVETVTMDRLSQLRSSTGAQANVFTPEETELWKLATALWDDLYVSDEAKVGNYRQKEAFFEGQRREEVGKWLKDAVRSTAERDVGDGGIRAVFAYLSGRMIASAVSEAVRTRDFRLATVLAQLGGANAKVTVRSDGGGGGGGASGHGAPGRGGTSGAVAEHLDKQVEFWERQKKENGDDIGKDYLKVWKLAAGNIARWGPEMFETLGDDWKRAFGLFVWYGGGGGWSIGEALEQYENVRIARFPRPLPAYLVGRDVAQKEERQNIYFQLLKVFAAEEGRRRQLLGDEMEADEIHRNHRLEEALQPLNVGPNPVDHRVPWLIHAILWLVKGQKGFVNDTVNAQPDDSDGSVPGRTIQIPKAGRTADRMTLFLVDQLESLGLWTWAVFVALFLRTAEGREGVVRGVLARWVSRRDTSGSWWLRRVRGGAGEGDLRAEVERAEEWRFLTEDLKIPKGWIHEAKALRAKYDGDVWQEAISLIDAKRYAVAQRIVMKEIAPHAIINRNHHNFRRLLTAIPSDKVAQYDQTIGLLETYIAITEEIPGHINTVEVQKRVLHEALGVNEVRARDAEQEIENGKAALGQWSGRLTRWLRVAGDLQGVEGVRGGGGEDDIVKRVYVKVMCGEVVRTCGDVAKVLEVTLEQLLPADLLAKLPLTEDDRLFAFRRIGTEAFAAQIGR